jgi:hypothetical protein
MRLLILFMLAVTPLFAACSMFSSGDDDMSATMLAESNPSARPPAPAEAPPARGRPASPTPVTSREAEQVRMALSDSAPDTYTVVRGDTLWDISARFLNEPWLWPEIWYVNEQIENPHLIYPGDRISLVYVDGMPQLRLERGGVARADDTTRLSPRVRTQSLDEAITTIPYDAIAPFLSRPTVLSRAQIKRSPYVLRLQGEHLIGGQGNRAYVRGPGLTQNASFTLLRLGDRYQDPENGRFIGQEALFVGQGRIVREGDPATMMLMETEREVLEGDVLLPLDTDVPLNYFPSAPSTRIEGSIVEVVDGISLIGQYQIIVLNRGRDDGLEQGHVLEVFQRGEKVRDRNRATPFAKVRLPEEYAGRVLVFRVLEDISYALVMSATSEMRVADRVRTPGELSREEMKALERMASRER